MNYSEDIFKICPEYAYLVDFAYPKDLQNWDERSTINSENYNCNIAISMIGYLPARDSRNQYYYPFWIITFSILGLFNFISNSFLCYIIYSKEKFFKSMTHRFILMLCCSNLTFCLVALELVIALSNSTRNAGSKLCSWIPYTTHIFSVTNLFMCVFVSIDRYKLVINPGGRIIKNGYGQLYAYLLITLISIILAAPTYHYTRNSWAIDSKNQPAKICAAFTNNKVGQTIYYFLGIFMLSFFGVYLVIWFYYKLYKSVQIFRKQSTLLKNFSKKQHSDSDRRRRQRQLGRTFSKNFKTKSRELFENLHLRQNLRPFAKKRIKRANTLPLNQNFKNFKKDVQETQFSSTSTEGLSVPQKHKITKYKSQPEFQRRSTSLIIPKKEIKTFLTVHNIDFQTTGNSSDWATTDRDALPNSDLSHSQVEKSLLKFSHQSTHNLDTCTFDIESEHDTTIISIPEKEYENENSEQIELKLQKKYQDLSRSALRRKSIKITKLNKKRNVQLEMMKSILYVTSLFIIMRLPIILFPGILILQQILFYYEVIEFIWFDNDLLMVSYGMIILGAGLNSVVYGCLNQHYRVEAGRIWDKFRRRRKR